ncbi:Pkinase-domain-containing protein [Marasmius fiardii PR-910]|nr:Pkinase-domain-containing protein [Marasmius fiardii PR-910]
MSSPSPALLNGTTTENGTDGSLRKKRNFKSLQLPTASRQAPLGPRPRPPLLTTTIPTPGSGSSSSASRLQLPSRVPDNENDQMLSPESSSNQRKTLQLALEKLDLNGKAKDKDHQEESNGKKRNVLDALPRPEDLKNLEELGMGNGGSVMKVEHVPSGIVMAKKIVLIDAKPSVRKQILRELHIMHTCDSPYIVSSYGAFLADPNICICMEFMDKKSFDGIYKRIGAIDIDVVGQVANSVLKGLLYLYDVHRIVHRDIKPSNILLNSTGEVKLCDFGVSGELINSFANTFVGTSIYMSPERIQGAEYSIRSDVWSLGIAIVELAHGRFPFSECSDDFLNSESTLGGLDGPGRPPSTLISTLQQTRHISIPEEKELPPLPPLEITTTSSGKWDSLAAPGAGNGNPNAAGTRRRSRGVSLHGGAMTMSILELMHLIVREPAPTLVDSESSSFPREAKEFVDACLEKDFEKRKTPKELVGSEWFGTERVMKVDMKVWAESV